MRYIAIVEDEDEAADRIKSFIDKFSAETEQDFEIDRFNDAVDLIENYQPKYAVIFMDIQMPHSNGMNAAVHLRKIDKSVSLIFITNLIQYAQKGYEVDAVAYILKPVQYYDFALKFRKALDIYVMNYKQDFTLYTSEGACRISTDKLMYVETVRHRLYYHLIDGAIERTGVLSKVEDELRQFGFLRCNSCYLVNPRFIVAVKGGCVQLGSEMLTISRPRKKYLCPSLPIGMRGWRTRNDFRAGYISVRQGDRRKGEAGSQSYGEV